MSRSSLPAASARRSLVGWLAALTLATSTVPALAAPDDGSADGGATAVVIQAGLGHLVVSEVATGGASASDEFVELYNPDPAALPLEGLELIYVTASGATVTRKAVWAAGAAAVPSGGHLLIANEAGIFASIADLTYANGLAATGGSLALRIVGASTSVDAVGWGNSANGWLEGSAALAPAAGHSLERLPGGAQGSGQDTDQNAIDFVEREVPDPQNGSSPPVPTGSPVPSPSGEATPSPTGSASEPTATPIASGSPHPTPTTSPTAAPTSSPPLSPTPSSSQSPSPTPLTVAQARALPDGSGATIEAVSLTEASFSDGGGYVADATGGIAVLVTDGTFPRGVLLRVTGVTDDRYHQRTLRAAAADVIVLGAAVQPVPIPVTSGGVGEPVEGQLVALTAVIESSATQLSGGVAFDLDDGSGSVRVLVGDLIGIDTANWERGTSVALHGVVGQRDSSGTGTAGYRVQPRDPADIVAVTAPSAPTATPGPSSTPTGSASPSGTPEASPSAAPPSPLMSISAARQATSGTRVRVRGVVTLPTGLSEPGSAVIQDASGGLLIRLGDDIASLARGELVELSGTRSTKAGMLSLRVSVPPVSLGRQAEPSAQRSATGRLGEGHEALVVVVRGAVSGNVQRTSAGNTYFDLDDGSGPVRIFVSPRASVSTTAVVAGAWLEVTGVLGQDTTSQQPTRGYRIWPRGNADLTVLAGPVADAESAVDASRAVAGASRGVGGHAAAEGGALDLPAPRLARPVPTDSPPRMPVAPPSTASEPDEGPPLGIAGMALGGLLLLLGAGAGTGPGLIERVRAMVAPSLSDDDVDRVPGLADPDADPVERLVALTVLDGRGAAPGARDAASPNSGRILPPI